MPNVLLDANIFARFARLEYGRRCRRSKSLIIAGIDDSGGVCQKWLIDCYQAVFVFAIGYLDETKVRAVIEMVQFVSLIS